MVKLKLRAVGTSTGSVLRKEALHGRKVKSGDNLFAMETPEGCLLTPYDPALQEQLKLGREIMAEHRETLRALAK